MEILFYQLKHESKLADFQVKLCAKVWRSTVSMSVLAPYDQLAALDEALWTVPGFIPHQIGADKTQPKKLQLVAHLDGIVSENVLNMTEEAQLVLPSTCQRVIEVFSESTKLSARAKYQAYRKQGFELKHHNV